MVIGTTADYIDIICQRFPGRAVFLTDARERDAAAEPTPDAATEVLCELTQSAEARPRLVDHLERWRIEPSGVACFDCESMALAAYVAESLGLPYPSADAVAACRSKLDCKQRWRQAGLPCPDAAVVEHSDDALEFMDRVAGPVVLKPLTGSGSELTFLCADHGECAHAFRTIESRLAQHPDVRMYPPAPQGDAADARRAVEIEQFIDGTEYSCDFAIERERVTVIRVAKKLPAHGQPFGTTLAYVVPGELPPGLDSAGLRKQLGRAALAVGLDRALCMVDFIVRDGTAWMLEIAPRPGGDCLPPLLMRSGGLDILGCALDFAEGRPMSLPASARWRPMVGLRLFADRAGILDAIDAEAIRHDPRVLECGLKHGHGHRVVLPPEDYDSRLLGHVIFEPNAATAIEAQCLGLAAKLRLEMRTP